VHYRLQAISDQARHEFADIEVVHIHRAVPGLIKLERTHVPKTDIRHYSLKLVRHVGRGTILVC
jgi:hypothetical protein